MDSTPPTELEAELAEGRTDEQETASDATSTDEDGSLNRRKVLGGLSAATASTAAFTGSASAEVDGPASLADRKALSEAKRVLPQEYAEMDLRSKMENEAETVLQTLSEEGLLAEASVDAFDQIPQEKVEEGDLQQGKVLMTVGWESVRNQPVAELFTRIETEDGEVRLHNSPSVDVEPAATIFEDGDRVGRVTADGTLHEFDASAASSMSCTQCYKTCDPFPEIRGQGDCSTECMCGGCDPGTSCGGGGGGGW